MTRSSKKIGALALVALLAGASAATPSMAETTQVSRAQLVQIAASAVESDDPAELKKVIQIADVLIKVNPRDLDAHALRAKAYARLGNARESRRSAGVIYHNTENSSGKYGAAMLSAQGSVAAKDFPAAQLWARRALQNAGSKEQQAQAVQLYRGASNASPFKATLSLSAAPNSNINNGSFEDVIYLELFEGVSLPFTLSADARALPGYTATASGSLSYRLRRSEMSETALRFTGYGQLHWLSAEGKQTLEDAAAAETDPERAAELRAISGSDFNYYNGSLSLVHAQKLGGGFLANGVLTGGRDWYGGEKLSDFASAQLELSKVVMGGKGRPSLDLKVDHRFNQLGGKAAVTTASATLGHTQVLPWGHVLSGSLGYAQSFSSDASSVYKQPSIGVSYKIDSKDAFAAITVGANYAYRTFSSSPYSADGRQDHRLSAYAEAQFKKLSYLGFSPVVTLRAQRTNSNVSLYANQSITGGVSIRTSF